MQSAACLSVFMATKTHRKIYIADFSMTTLNRNTEITSTVPTKTLPYHCDFERGMCGMSAQSSTSLKWAANKGAVLFSGKQYIKGDNTTGNGKITLYPYPLEKKILQSFQLNCVDFARCPFKITYILVSVFFIYIKASAHSFKRFTSRLLKLSFSLSMHLYTSGGRHA